MQKPCTRNPNCRETELTRARHTANFQVVCTPQTPDSVVNESTTLIVGSSHSVPDVCSILAKGALTLLQMRSHQVAAGAPDSYVQSYVFSCTFCLRSQLLPLLYPEYEISAGNRPLRMGLRSIRMLHFRGVRSVRS